MNVCVYIGCARARSVVALRSSISNSNIIKKVERKNEINAGIELVVVLPLLLLLRIFLFFAFRHSRWNFLCGFFHIESPFAECSYGNSLSLNGSRCAAAAADEAGETKWRKTKRKSIIYWSFFSRFFFCSHSTMTPCSPCWVLVMVMSDKYGESCILVCVYHERSRVPPTMASSRNVKRSVVHCIYIDIMYRRFAEPFIHHWTVPLLLLLVLFCFMFHSKVSVF